MGRAAKYHTQADRKAARRAQNARYAMSDLGKHTRAAARARAHAERSDVIECEQSFEIPDALRSYATRPFNMTFSFREQSGPSLGLLKPPFNFRLPDARSLQSVERRGGQEPLVVKLHTLQFTWAIDDAYARRTQWLLKPTEEVTRLAEAEIRARVRGWMRMAARALGAGIEGDIREVAMRWGARRVIMLMEELQFRRQGRDAYIEARLTGQTPLQKLVRENKLNFQQITAEADSEED